MSSRLDNSTRKLLLAARLIYGNDIIRPKFLIDGDNANFNTNGNYSLENQVKCRQQLLLTMPTNPSVSTQNYFDRGENDEFSTRCDNKLGH